MTKTGARRREFRSLVLLWMKGPKSLVGNKRSYGRGEERERENSFDELILMLWDDAMKYGNKGKEEEPDSS